jgi:hypothetical protein
MTYIDELSSSTSSQNLYRAKKVTLCYLYWMKHPKVVHKYGAQILVPCAVCGVMVDVKGKSKRARARENGYAFCSTEHKNKWCNEKAAAVRRKTVEMVCAVCGKSIVGTGTTMGYALKRGRAYCSLEHAQEMKSILLRATAGSPVHVLSGRKTAARMRRCNPMHDPVTRSKVSIRLREICHKPPIRGGNGTGITEPQRVLFEALGGSNNGWFTEHVVCTAKGMQPNHFKIDIACPDSMIAIEVDGRSHSALNRQVSDVRKTKFLVGLGWTVLRFSNREVMADTAACAQIVLKSMGSPQLPSTG